MPPVGSGGETESQLVAVGLAVVAAIAAIVTIANILTG